MLKGIQYRSWAHKLAVIFRAGRPELGKIAERPLPRSAAPTSSPLLPSVSCLPEHEFSERNPSLPPWKRAQWIPFRAMRVGQLAMNAMFDRWALPRFGAALWMC